jgi:hypothetical protein
VPSAPKPKPEAGKRDDRTKDDKKSDRQLKREEEDKKKKLDEQLKREEEDKKKQ